MNADTRYIYKVTYGQKSSTEDYEVIKQVHFWYWDPLLETHLKNHKDAHKFALGLIRNKYKAQACGNCDKGEMCQEVIGYRQQDDGECWIKTSRDDTAENNLEFLKYCKSIGIAVLLQPEFSTM